MTYSVHQPWDLLKVCVVGRSYPPEYYKFITDSKVRNVLEQIACETEEDYQGLIQVLEQFGVQVIRTEIPNTFNNNILSGKHLPPPMTPRDHMAMIGDQFFMPSPVGSKWTNIKGSNWPNTPPMSDDEFDLLLPNIKQELAEQFNIRSAYSVHDYDHAGLESIGKLVQQQGNTITYDKKIDTAMVARIGRDLYFGTWSADDDQQQIQAQMSLLFPNYRCHVINTCGHLDGTFSVIKPGVIVSSTDISKDVYADKFPGWEVIYIKQPVDTVKNSKFQQLKQHNQGKWWVPGQESNNEFIQYIENYMSNWLGYIEETTIDVNMLSIDQHNVLCINENQELFTSLAKHNVTPHVVKFRHHMFWDGGLHCVTNDLNRQGTLTDYFPERN